MVIDILASGILSALAFWTVAYCPLLLCQLAFQHWRFFWIISDIDILGYAGLVIGISAVVF